MKRRIISFIFCFLLLSFNTIPVLASDGGNISLISVAGEVTGLLDWVIDRGYWAERTIVSIFDGDVCPGFDNPVPRHHFVDTLTSRNGVSGHYYMCEYCGKFASELLKEAESEYVASLPASTVTSDGGYLWYSTRSDFSTICVENGSTHFTVPSSSSGIFYANFSDERTIHIKTLSTFSRTGVLGFNNASADYNKLTLPFRGYYYLMNTPFIGGDYSSSYSVVDYGLKGAGTIITISTKTPSMSILAPFDYDLYLPVFKIVPSTPYNVSSINDNDTYNIGTRAASITGNYGVVNSNGTVTQVESQSIVNEGDSTVYNPVTNETHSMADWSYDYSDRSYHVTTEQGDTLTVTYGDENVTIQEGDNVYNVYYITNTSSGDNEGGNSGSGETPTPTHTHNYTSDITSAPTCTLPGVRTFSCSCGASYTQQIVPAGHTWGVKNHVNMEYDAEGELLQQGYTVYRCSVCGEEYRSPDDSLPPGLMETDNQLAEVSNKVLAWYNSLRELYQGYVGFLTDAFRFLPDELVALIEFGIGSSFVIAVSKKLLR